MKPAGWVHLIATPTISNHHQLILSRYFWLKIPFFFTCPIFNSCLFSNDRSAFPIFAKILGTHLWGCRLRHSLQKVRQFVLRFVKRCGEGSKSPDFDGESMRNLGTSVRQLVHLSDSCLIGVSILWGYPQMDGFCKGKSHLEMDENWGYPYFRKPPFGSWNFRGLDWRIGFAITNLCLAADRGAFCSDVSLRH